MKKDEIQAWDIQRILFGQAPAEFLIEVLIRTLLMYGLLVIILRLLGKRMDAQLTLTELAVMVTLGAIVSVPMQIPDRGLLLGALALLCVLAFQRGLNWLTLKSARFEEITQGTMSIMIKKGVLQLDEMLKAGISRQSLYAELRKEEIYNLGKIKRLYFEACGVVSVYTEDEIKPGLPIMPPSEQALFKSVHKIAGKHRACANCGFTIEARAGDKNCPNCNEQAWTEAIL